MALRRTIEKRTPKFELFLDSGAFSAWRLGKPVNLDAYCDYILANQDWIAAYACLDVINPEDPEAAAAASFENYLYMRKRGLRPVPVFHVKEDIKWLYRMVDAGAEYIGLSASSLVSRNAVNDWYGHAWDQLVDSDGRPIVKAHAFGEGRESAMELFPWYSADSTSWIYTAQRNGVILLRDGRKVAHRNDKLNVRAMQDLDSLAEHDAAELSSYLERCGVDPRSFDERGKHAFTVKSYLAALYYLDIEARVNAKLPIRHRRPGFFKDELNNKVGADPERFKFNFVLGNNTLSWAAFHLAKGRYALVSYFYIAQSEKNHYQALKEFVLDPDHVVNHVPLVNNYWKILKEYVTHVE